MNLFSGIKKLFENFQNKQERYKKIIELGKALEPMPDSLKTEENRIAGCQSMVYLHSELREGKIYFTAYSDALITAGLAALLIKAYNGQPPQILLQYKPTFLEELDIPASLSPSRSNGLSLIHLRMQRDAVKFLKGIST